MGGFAVVSVGSVGWFLAASGVAKLIAPSALIRALSSAKAGAVANAFAVRTLAVFELTLGCVTASYPTVETAAAASILLAVFTLFLLVLHRQAPGVGCGCLGDTGSTASATSIGRNAVLLALAALGLFSSREQTLASAATAAGLAALVAIATQGMDVLVQLRLVTREGV